MSSDVTCPQCNGRAGPTIAFVNRGPEHGCSVEERQCSRCNGKGTITAYEHGLYLEGRRVRDSRVAADLSLRDAAKLFGCTAPELSDIEHGRAPAHHDILIRKLVEHIKNGAPETVVKRGGPFENPFRRNGG